MSAESARHWRHPGVPGVDLLRARYVEHSFTRHTHEGHVFGVIRYGVEDFYYRGRTHSAPAGAIVLVDPDEVHTGHAGTPAGWAYRTCYPARQVVTDIGAEVSALRGTPHFPEPVVWDAAAARTFVAAHRAAERGDRLAASTLIRTAIARLVQRFATPAPPRRRTASPAVARLARDLLVEQLADPPALEALATELGVGPFPLLRAFRAEYGLPPHTYLIQERVERARGLLDAGESPARVAAEVGFADQPHLTRHFKRVHGIGPGAYRRERRNVQDGAAEPT